MAFLPNPNPKLFEAENAESKNILVKTIEFNRAVGGASVILWVMFIIPLVMWEYHGGKLGYLPYLSILFSPFIIIIAYSRSKIFYFRSKQRLALFVSFLCWWLIFWFVVFLFVG